MVDFRYWQAVTLNERDKRIYYRYIILYALDCCFRCPFTCEGNEINVLFFQLIKLQPIENVIQGVMVKVNLHGITLFLISRKQSFYFLVDLRVFLESSCFCQFLGFTNRLVDNLFTLLSNVNLNLTLYVPSTLMPSFLISALIVSILPLFLEVNNKSTNNTNGM